MDKDIENLAGRQRKALAEGRAAETTGQPVIYIHGRPYASNEGTRPGSKLAARDHRAVEVAEDHRHSVAPRKSELDMDL